MFNNYVPPTKNIGKINPLNNINEQVIRNKICKNKNDIINLNSDSMNSNNHNSPMNG